VGGSRGTKIGGVSAFDVNSNGRMVAFGLNKANVILVYDISIHPPRLSFFFCVFF